MRTWQHRSAGAAAMLILALQFLVPAAAQAQAGNVVLWNRLGSDYEIAHSEVGPGGVKTAGSFTPGPFANFGQAYLNNISNSRPLTFPADPGIRSKGTVAFWSKLNGFPSALFDWVGPLSTVDRGLPAFGWRMGFASNDGCGGYGLFGTVGVATNSYCRGVVDTATQTGTLDSILGDRGAWHHYALVWDEHGIPQLGGRKIYLFLDGKVVTTSYLLDQSPWGAIPDGSAFALAIFYNISGVSVAIDNFIVWNEVKTDFSDRFNESPFPTCDGVLPQLSALISSKTGPQDARNWTISVSNKSYCPGQSAQIDSLKLTQTYGVACTPVITSPTAFPLALGDIAANGKASGPVTINFSACPSTARFTARITYSANDGAVKGTKTLNNQFR